jgi:DNA-directed RNA polymerase subunit M/transcription elongation factor TFIIS
MSIEPEIGSWYIVVTCHKCKATVFLFRDLTEGEAPLSATYVVTCPRCGHEGEYEGRHYRYSMTN